jgi:hypothetical protein
LLNFLNLQCAFAFYCVRYQLGAPKVSNSISTADFATNSATSTTSFINSIGVAAHFWSYNSTYILSELSYLGISNVRDGAPPAFALSTYVAAAQAGVHFVLLEDNAFDPDQAGQVNAVSDVLRADALETAVPGSIIALEGSNEYDINTYYLNGISSYGNLSWGLADDAALQAAVRADPLMAGVSVIAASEVSTTAIPAFGTSADASNVHVYGGVGQQLQDGIDAWVAAAQASAPGKPVYITETGISSSGFNTSTWGVADAYTQGIIDTNALLDGYKAGAAITFLYELMDDPGAPNAQEQNFGLFNADGTPKPAAVDIGNLTHILQDNGPALTSPGTLAYNITGLPSTASSMLLEKSSGAFDIVLWNGDATLYNGTSVVTPPTSEVTITLPSAASSIEIFDPIQGTTAIETVSNASSVTVGLSADPIIIQVGPAVVQSSATLSTPPAAPLALTDSSVVNGYVNAAHDTAEQVITGTAQAGAVVTVYDNSLALGSAAADANGAWSFVLGVLPDGSHHMTAVAANDSGQTSATSAALNFVVDTVAPVPGVTDVVQTASNSVTITGVSATDSSVSVYDNGHLIGTTSASAGSWSLTSQLSNSAIHSLTETATDVAGNTGSAAGVTLYSNQSNQTLTGGAGADVLIGRSGDKLTGGAGSDVFVFNTGFGKEVVTDFTPSTATTQGDHIDISHAMVPDFAHMLTDAHQVGSNVVITVDKADVLTLNHVALSSLHAADFSFI